jgi:uncharacterized protein (DUF58 family)
MGLFRSGSVRPTKRVAVLVGLVGIATIVFGGGVAFAASMVFVVVGAFAFDAVLAVRARLACERTNAATVPLLAATPLVVTVTTAPTAPVRRLRQPLPPELTIEPDETAGTTLSATLRGRHRGEHALGPAVARVSGPLALASRDVKLGPTATVRVIPDLPNARRLAAARRGGGLDDGRARNRLGLGTEFEAIREYSPDDDIRQVNWVASSRAGRTLSNQYRIDENRDVVCMVDTGRLMASPVGELTRLDVALDAMTVLCVEAEESQDRVGALAFAGEVQRQLSPRRFGTAAIVDAFYDLEPTEIESDYERAFIAVGRHKRALVVVFTDLVDETVGRSLLSACQVLRRRHAVMVVSCYDDDLAAVVANEPDDLAAVLRTSVALDLVHAKNRVASLLRAMGVVVVEAPASRLGSASVRAYFTLQRRARA